MKKNTTYFAVLLSALFFALSVEIQAQSCPWAKKASGTNEDFGVALATDASGNVYYLGNFYSQSVAFGATVLQNQPYQAFNYGTEMFLVKYDSCGTLKWAKRAGGNSDVFGRGIACDASGNIYVTGTFKATTATFGTLTLNNSANYDVFLTKYDPNGTALWTTGGFGNQQDKAYAITVDGAGDVYISGHFSSTTLTFGTNSVNNGTDDGYTFDAFIAKFDNAGTNLWVRANTSHSSSSDHVYSYGVSSDAAGNVYACGSFGSDYIRFGNDSIAVSNPSDRDIYLVKYDATGNVQWLRTGGGSSTDAAYAIATDASGNSYITGYIGGQATADFSPLALVNNSANRAIFLTKYDMNGTPQWANTAQGDFYSDNVSNCVTLDANGDPYIIGAYSSDSLNVGPVTLFNASLMNGSGGGDYFYDVFVAKYKSNGSLSWARTAGGDSTDLGNGIACGPNGALYITGEYFSPTLDFHGIPLTGVNSTGDAFIANNIAATSLTPDICLVSSDSTSTNNVVYWDKTSFTTVKDFIVYREVSTGTYKRIGVVPYDSLSQFIDTARTVVPANGDPNVGTYRYKLQTGDTSDCLSPMSPYHNTV
ncbi:MAG: SBBP repeat-containing protein, partial [Bacteroidia bacterium]